MTLTPEVAVLGISIGLVFSLVCYLVTNLSPGGMITPGWLAILLITDSRRAVLLTGVVIGTFSLARILDRFVILYGKRLFASVVLIGVFIQISLFFVLLARYPLLFTHETLGFIIPGLIAYQMIRQPIAATLVSTAVVTASTYGVILAGVLLHFIPTT